MRTAVALMALAEENDTVFHSVRARRFHDDPTCSALRAGHWIHHCLCGDPYCGCRADPPPVTRKVSIGDAAMLDLVPCAECYPGFQELAVQLPSDDHFGHVPIDEYGANRANVSRVVCSRCVSWFRITASTAGGGKETYLMGRRVEWPCTSAQVLGVAPRREEKIT